MPLSPEFFMAANQLVDAENRQTTTLIRTARDWCEGTNHAWQALEDVANGKVTDDPSIATQLRIIKPVVERDMRLKALWDAHAKELEALCSQNPSDKGPIGSRLVKSQVIAR